MTLFLRAMLLTIALLAASSAVPVAVGSAPSPRNAITIMELGDSITAGVAARGVDNGEGGYRLPLARRLKAAGYLVTMVGERSDFSGRLAIGKHEGWPGYVLRSYPSDPAPQLYGELTHRAISTYRPSIVLLMAGTNDLLRYARHARGYSLPHIDHSLDLEIKQIVTLDPSSRVIVAPVVDSPRVPRRAVTAFAHHAAVISAKYRARGYRVELAIGMDNAVPRNAHYFPDGIHPSGADGYARIASVWHSAIDATIAAWPPGAVHAATVAHRAVSRGPLRLLALGGVCKVRARTSVRQRARGACRQLLAWADASEER